MDAMLTNWQARNAGEMSMEDYDAEVRRRYFAKWREVATNVSWAVGWGALLAAIVCAAIMIGGAR